MNSLPARAESLPIDEAELAKQILLGRPGYLIRRLNQIHYAMFFEECGHENVTPVQYGVLTAVKVRPGVDQTEIGAYLGLDRTTTADVVRRLEGKGYLRRQVDQRDRRSRQVFITDEGLRITQELLAGMRAASDRLLQPLDAGKRRQFLELLAELVEANDAYGRGRQSRV
ncbi:MarR family winged helix-turn-helix transcriptional regulator [Paracoccus luteus]|uniref:MarR family winged helix-turn-helix transcriptional regulator n=1 Tax=Paracoccus luteus TaxID=2508543 RepID=UPI00106FA518|nr:MarR family winged helix-turn-helix transcriptional regulator [Paracoccus luteus]